MLEVILAIVNMGFIPSAYGYIILGIFEFFIYQYLKKGKIITNSVCEIPVWILVITGLMYAVGAIGRSPIFNGLFRYCIMPALIFMIGHSITNNGKEKAVRNAEKCLGAIAIGCGVHVFLNIIANIGADRAHTSDYFTGELAATNLGSLNTFIFALLPCLFTTNNKKIKIIGFILFFMSVVYSVMLGTRTQIYALAVILAVCVIFSLGKLSKKSITLKKLLSRFSAAASVTFVAIIVYKTDFLGLRTKFITSNLIFRYTSDNTVVSDANRFRLMTEGFRSLIENPFGESGYNTIRYFHNYWLDFGRVAGIIPVILLVIMDIVLIYHMIQIFRNSNIETDFRYAILGIYICFFINFFMEPIMDGYMDLFYRFIFINGMAEGVYRRVCYKNKYIRR